tara:strand:- start:165 stop:2384 length:2220 start_codon:yes stop_codon:yes gene_type:complete
MGEIDYREVALALDKVSTSDFENFGQVFLSDIYGVSFVPMGGMHDGGADGIDDSSLFEVPAQRRVAQISKESDHRSKIRKTAKRLIEFGRDVAIISYLTSKIVPNFDVEEEDLSAELGIPVKIRDGQYIRNHINRSEATKQGARSYLLPAVNFLSGMGSSNIMKGSEKLPSKSLCVFMRQEVDRTSGKQGLLESVTDSLILWSLNDTDPDKGVFKSRAEIKEEILRSLPSAKDFIHAAFNNRLEILSKKDAPGGRVINHHRKDDKFCLPYETRKTVSEENLSDEYLKVNVSIVFADRISELMNSADDDDVDLITSLTHESIESAFEQRGLDVIQYIHDREDNDHQKTMDEFVKATLDRNDITGEKYQDYRLAILYIIRKAFYNSTSVEREYFQKLSKTYTLLFILKNEPSIIEYFQSMSANFMLYVGSDILVRCISEHYLDEVDQMTCNMLKVLSASGSTLFLTEKALDEVCGNLRKANNSYTADCAAQEPYITAVSARNLSHILVRAFFYALKNDIPEARKPAGWKSHIENFMDYSKINTQEGKEQLRAYLCKKFGLTFVSSQELAKSIDIAELDGLARKVQDVKKYRDGDEFLARNDALQVLKVYRHRMEIGDISGSNPLGFRVWWLTDEKRILAATGDLVKKQVSRYIIRPEFLLNFISVLPSVSEVTKSFRDIFPTMLGIKMSNRMKERDFLAILKKATQMKDVDPARADVMLANLSTELMGNLEKDYEVKFKES